MSVPCGTCRACCYHPNVDLFPEAGDDIASYQTTTKPDGTPILKKRADGACIYLGDNGCTIHHRRPHACRVYDCRVPMIMHVSDRFTDEQTAPFWILEMPTARDKAIAAALGMAMQIYFEKGEGDFSGLAILLYAATRFNEFYPMCLEATKLMEQELPKLPPDQLALLNEQQLRHSSYVHRLANSLRLDTAKPADGSGTGLS